MLETWEVEFDEKHEIPKIHGTSRDNGVNVGQVERIASAIGGGGLIAYGLSNRSLAGSLLAVLGAALLHRGVTGYCHGYQALGINTAESSTANDEEVARDVHVEKSIAINSTPEELYSFWRDFENLPRFMENLESVTKLDETRSHWVATGPGGKRIEWDAEIYNEHPNELIAWRSLPDADVTNAGAVRFETAAGGRGTIVRVTLNYNPPGGTAGKLIAKLFGEEPGQLVENNLRRFKQLIETGDIPTTEGQSSGREELSAAATATGERKGHKMASKAPVKDLGRNEQIA